MKNKLKIIKSTNQEKHEEKINEFITLSDIEIVKLTHKAVVVHNNINYITFIEYKEGELVNVCCHTSPRGVVSYRRFVS